MRTQTIEQTGKTWKLLMCISVLMLIGSATLGYYAWQQNQELVAISVIGWFVGICGIIAAKLGAWWFHG